MKEALKEVGLQKLLDKESLWENTSNIELSAG